LDESTISATALILSIFKSPAPDEPETPSPLLS
jgi:hypothetical protein